MQALKRYLLILLFSGFAFTGFTQKRKIDSLEKLLRSAPADTHRVTLLDKLSFQYAKVDPDKADSTARVEMGLAVKLDYKKGIAGAYLNLGSLHYKSGKIDTARIELQRSLAIYEELNYKPGIASVMLSTGGMEQSASNYKKALESFLRADKLGEEMGDKQITARSLHNIGMIYMEQGVLPQALDYYQKALKIKEEIGDKRSLYTTITNIGIVYFQMGETEKCEKFIRRAMGLAAQTGDQRAIATCLENLGNIYTIKKLPDSALVYYLQSKEIREKMNDPKGLASVLANIGESYSAKGETKKAIESQLQAVSILEKMGERVELQNIYHMLAETYEADHDYKSALEFNNKFIKLKDSIFNDNNTRQLAEMQAKYDTEKKQREIELLKKDSEMDKLYRNSLMVGVALLVVLAIVMLMRFREKQKNNRELSAKNQVIEESSAKLHVAFAEIEEKNKDITDSILYAKRIQDAILPSSEFVKDLLPDSFVLFRPRDIVSGDFFWVAEVGANVIVAVADCTGHGVPGAFMSMIGNTMLNEIVNVKAIIKPDVILEELDKGIRNALKSETKETSDGMDIALISLDKRKRMLEFAGAMRPMLVMRGMVLEEVKGDKRSVGGGSDNSKPFTAHSIPLNKGDSVYLFSDGYADQFGSEKGKKMMRKNFNELLKQYSVLPMDEQVHLLESSFLKWRGTYEQVDDVCVLGFRA